jgi:hypothetical protein
LKDTRKFSQKNAEADWAKLKKCLEHVPSIMGGFLIYIARHDSTVPGIKRDRQTMRLWPIWIALQKDIPDFEQWNAQYRERTRYHPKKDRLGAR